MPDAHELLRCVESTASNAPRVRLDCTACETPQRFVRSTGTDIVVCRRCGTEHDEDRLIDTSGDTREVVVV